MSIIIVGAGMAGLLAANMLHRHNPLVMEKAASLPNNHSAVLRFRSMVVSDVLGIPFKRVNVIKDALPWRNPVADALAYSAKNSGVMRSDRSITAGLVVGERFIAPADLIQQMADRIGTAINYDCDWTPTLVGRDEPTISTIPMPLLMRKLGWEPSAAFGYSPAVNVRAKVRRCDAYVSLMVPDPKIPFSRVSVTGDELIVEVPGATKVRENDTGYAAQAAWLLGIDPDDLYDISAHESTYAKILPVPDDERKQFIYEASTKHNIYSLGRFATWRPGLLMDDLVHDVRKIEGWLSGSRYNLAKEQS